MRTLGFLKPVPAAEGSRAYRLEIEGLRAVAVIAVLVFHVGFPLTGGYIGVDVFFVISGFLITRNILKDQQAGTFTFTRFYVRRIRRLFPALAATLLATLAGGFLFFAPDDMRRVGQAAVFSVVSLSNVLFWRETGYFDPAAALKPLLHTWSLGVEEQFYLLWPVIVVCATRLGRSRGVASIVVMIGISSFVSAELLRATNPGAVFYLMPFRMFELCAGGAFAVLEPKRPAPSVAPLATIAGLFAVAYAAAYFDATTSQRHVWALLPCVGAVLVIYGGSNRWSNVLLSNRFVAGVGTISYSLYLVHWPVIVFDQYARGAELSATHKWLVVMLCVLLAAMMYRLVELPFRSGRADRVPVRTRTAMFASAALALLVSAIGWNAWHSGGWPWRLPTELRNLPSETAMWDERNPRARVGMCFVHAPVQLTLDESHCLARVPGKPNYLILGDSFAADAYVYLSAAYPNVNFLQATAGNCHPLFGTQTGDGPCSALLQSIFTQFIPGNTLDGVVLSAAWQWQDLDPLEKTIDYLQTLTPRVVLIGSGIRFPANVQPLMFRSKRLTIDGVERFVDAQIHPFEHTLNDIIRTRFQPKVDRYIDVQAIMCENHCRLFTPDGHLIYIDFGHLTLAGSLFLAPKIAAHYGDMFSLSASVR